MKQRLIIGLFILLIAGALMPSHGQAASWGDVTTCDVDVFNVEAMISKRSPIFKAYFECMECEKSEDPCGCIKKCIDTGVGQYTGLKEEFDSPNGKANYKAIEELMAEELYESVGVDLAEDYRGEMNFQNLLLYDPDLSELVQDNDLCLPENVDKYMEQLDSAGEGACNSQSMDKVKDLILKRLNVKNAVTENCSHEGPSGFPMLPRDSLSHPAATCFSDYNPDIFKQLESVDEALFEDTGVSTQFIDELKKIQADSAKKPNQKRDEVNKLRKKYNVGFFDVNEEVMLELQEAILGSATFHPQQQNYTSYNFRSNDPRQAAMRAEFETQILPALDKLNFVIGSKTLKGLLLDELLNNDQQRNEFVKRVQEGMPLKDALKEEMRSALRNRQKSCKNVIEKMGKLCADFTQERSIKNSFSLDEKMKDLENLKNFFDDSYEKSYQKYIDRRFQDGMQAGMGGRLEKNQFIAYSNYIFCIGKEEREKVEKERQEDLEKVKKTIEKAILATQSKDSAQKRAYFNKGLDQAAEGFEQMNKRADLDSSRALQELEQKSVFDEAKGLFQPQEKGSRGANSGNYSDQSIGPGSESWQELIDEAEKKETKVSQDLKESDGKMSELQEKLKKLQDEIRSLNEQREREERQRLLAEKEELENQLAQEAQENAALKKQLADAQNNRKVIEERASGSSVAQVNNIQYPQPFGQNYGPVGASSSNKGAEENQAALPESSATNNTTVSLPGSGESAASSKSKGESSEGQNAGGEAGASLAGSLGSTGDLTLKAVKLPSNISLDNNDEVKQLINQYMDQVKEDGYLIVENNGEYVRIDVIIENGVLKSFEKKSVNKESASAQKSPLAPQKPKPVVHPDRRRYQWNPFVESIYNFLGRRE